MANDRRTIGIAKDNASALAALVDAGHFESELDAAKFAMALAIREGLPSGTTEGTDTKWNVGSVDPDGSLRTLLEALYSGTEEPYRLLEYLVNEGLRRLPATPDVWVLLRDERQENR